MLPSNFPEANTSMHKPEGWTDEQCMSLPAWRGVQELSGGMTQPCFISYWKPSKKDLETLNNGGGIYLGILSPELPPAFLTTENPFKTEPT